MEQLPVEIVEKILTNPKISIEDIVRFSLTCQHFQNVVMNSNKIWKTKFFQKWPHLRSILENIKHIVFQHEVRYIYELKKRTT
ncbi:hypothetical protein NQ317_016061 [Molorchus minor]|uniref:F-box domain-containing protein n=1 Tax=Molorchus minor TaxID=1323400 RepID=A0ABQ9JFH7_9CUCU|nr:hypothetical protein NQ317_016061 [Molorchus minor]